MEKLKKKNSQYFHRHSGTATYGPLAESSLELYLKHNETGISCQETMTDIWSWIAWAFPCIQNPPHLEVFEDLILDGNWSLLSKYVIHCLFLASQYASCIYQSLNSDLKPPAHKKSAGIWIRSWAIQCILEMLLKCSSFLCDSNFSSIWESIGISLYFDLFFVICMWLS